MQAASAMMTREQHLLAILAEECAEVAQRASKAIRFGLERAQPEQPLSNRARLEQELGDLMGVADLLGFAPDREHRAKKAARVEKYMKYSAELGQVVASPEAPVPKPTTYQATPPYIPPAWEVPRSGYQFR